MSVCDFRLEQASGIGDWAGSEVEPSNAPSGWHCLAWSAGGTREGGTMKTGNIGGQ